jgi:hypothetical protein
MKQFGFLFAILFLFAACDSMDMDDKAVNDVRPAPTIEASGMQAFSVADSKVMMRETNENQKIIRTANLRYEVNNMETALTNIKDLLLSYQGDVENERQYSQSDRLTASLVVRVPAKDFEPFIDDLLKGESIRRLEERSISARDITEQFIDVEARLKTKKQTMARYQDLLQQAKTVSEIINVEDKIRRLQEEIESQEGRLKYLSDQVDMSEVRINIYEITKTTYVPDKSNGFLPTVLRALHGGLQGIFVVLLWIVRLWPLWLLYIIIRLIIKARKKDE